MNVILVNKVRESDSEPEMLDAISNTQTYRVQDYRLLRRVETATARYTWELEILSGHKIISFSYFHEKS